MPIVHRLILGLSIPLLLAAGCLLEPEPTSTPAPTSTPTQTSTPRATATPRPTPTPSPTPNPTKQMAGAIEAEDYIAANAWQLTAFSTDAICQGKYDLGNARALDGKIYGFQFATGLSRGGLGEPFYDTPKWHRDLQDLTQKLKQEIKNIKQYCK